MSLSRRICLLAALGLLIAGIANAQPDPALSDAPSGIMFGGRRAPCVADPGVTATYVIRDINGPMQGVVVVLGFSKCTDVSCQASFSGGTNAAGAVSFTLSGYGNGGGFPRAICDCVDVTAIKVPFNPVPFPSIGVSTLDRDGVNGMGAGDLALFISDFVNFPMACRSDFSGNDTLGAEDLAIWLNIFVAGNSPITGNACGC